MPCRRARRRGRRPGDGCRRPSRPPEGVTKESSPAAGSMARRLSRGSTPARRATFSTVRSMANAASGEPKPRYAPDGVLLVTTQATDTSVTGMSYGPVRQPPDTSVVEVPGMNTSPEPTLVAMLPRTARMRPVAVVGRLHVHPLLPGVDRGHQVLGAVLDPAHRTPRAHRQPRHDDVLRVLVQLAPEPSTDVRDDDPDAGLAQPEHHGQGGAEDVRALSRCPHRQPAVLVVGDDAAGLHRARRLSLHAERRAHDVVLGEDPVDLGLGHREVHQLVVRPVVVEPRGVVGQRRFDGDHDRQLVVVHDARVRRRPRRRSDPQPARPRSACRRSGPGRAREGRSRRPSSTARGAGSAPRRPGPPRSRRRAPRDRHGRRRGRSR